MTATTIETFSAPEVAYLLRDKLGGIVAWADWLADAARGRTSLVGRHTLRPCCRQHDLRGLRPRYAASDVFAFIDAVLHDVPGAGPKAAQSAALQVDRNRDWKGQHFDRFGAPITPTFDELGELVLDDAPAVPCRAAIPLH